MRLIDNNASEGLTHLLADCSVFVFQEGRHSLEQKHRCDFEQNRDPLYPFWQFHYHLYLILLLEK